MSSSAGRSRSLVATLVVAVVAGAAFEASPAQASPGSTAAGTDADRRERARALANDGYARFQKGAFEEALAIFERAERSFHAVTILLMVARCQARTGHVADAGQTYRRVIAERLEPSSPAALREAQRRARSELDELTARSATFVLDRPLARGEKLLVDGREAVGVEPGEPQ
ncbi:MAG: hypothetical protein FJ096_21850, partial [Deltaproteobacteria bacterium]|nr:hypothetical protein [Deltaproteobacteria bacterium]